MNDSRLRRLTTTSAMMVTMTNGLLFCEKFDSGIHKFFSQWRVLLLLLLPASQPASQTDRPGEFSLGQTRTHTSAALLAPPPSTAAQLEDGFDREIQKCAAATERQRSLCCSGQRRQRCMPPLRTGKRILWAWAPPTPLPFRLRLLAWLPEPLPSYCVFVCELLFCLALSVCECGT